MARLSGAVAAMTAPFERIRLRRKPAPPAQAAAAAAAPVQVYEALFLRRGLSLLLVLVWTPVVIGIFVLIVVYEREMNAIPYSLGPRVFLSLAALASLALVPLLGPTSRRRWTLFPDRIEILERPYVPGFGRRRRASIPFRQIAFARLGEELNTMHVLELESADGRRFRLRAANVGKGNDVRLDTEGFNQFIQTIRETIIASGAPLPPGEELKTATSGFLGIVILAVMTAFLGALVLVGVVMTLMSGEAVGLSLSGFILPFALLFGGLLAARWRKWRASPS